MRSTGLLVLIVFFISYSCQPTQPAERPNIVFIMSDDHTAQAIGAYNDRFAELNPTPTIDRLAEEGMLFENVFCTNSICTPSRACIMTGQYNHVNGVLDLDGELSQDRHYLAIEMKKAGYIIDKEYDFIKHQSFTIFKRKQK